MCMGTLKRMMAVCLALTLIFGFSPFMEHAAKAAADVYLSYNAEPGVPYRFSFYSFFDDFTTFGRYGFTQPSPGGADLYDSYPGPISAYESYSNSFDTSYGLDFYSYDFYAVTGGTYTFSVILEDWDNGTGITTFHITFHVVSDNDAPTDIALSASNINASSTGAGATVGTLSSTDAGDTHTYSLVSGTGDTNNGDFQISGTTLQTSKALTAGSYSILVRSTDNGSLYFDKAFTINVFTAPSVTTNDAGSISTTGATLNGTVNANNASTVVTFSYGTSASYGTTVTSAESPVTGTASTSVSNAITGLTPNTSYHFKVTGVNAAGTVNGSDMTFTTGTAAPVVTTDAAGGITDSAATLHGTVNANNEGTAVTFQYGTTTGYGSYATAAQSPVTGTGDTSVSFGLTGLIPNTTYHYRVVAENPTGRTEGSDQTFTTLAKEAAVTTGSAGSITTTGATLVGSVNANNADTTVTFEYGLTTSYGSTVTADESPATGMVDTSVSKAVTGLLPNTTYHFRAIGENTAGTTFGLDATFTTDKAPPSAATDAASGLSSSGATLNGTVNANNESTTVTFEYGTSVSYGSYATAAQSPVTGTGDTSVSFGLTGLIPNTTYHYRVVAENPTGRTEGSDQTFTTLAKEAAVTTGSAGSITTTGATLVGSVNANNADTTVTFEYGLTTSYGSTVTADESPATGMVDTSVSKAVTGLLPNTTYHFRAIGENTAGTTFGLDATFTTDKAPPSAATDAASGLSSSGATLNGTVNANNESTTVTFEYGTSVSYGSYATANQSPVTGTGDTSVSFGLTGLIPNTTYHYRVVAVNPTGRTEGLDQTFTTSAIAPTVTTGSAGSITPSAATLTGTVNANNADTAVTFQYGLTTAYGMSITASPDTVTGTSNTNVSAALSGLLPYTTYHFRAVGVNTAGTIEGLDATFTTGKLAPAASTNAASHVAPTGATLRGTVNAMNDSTTVTFQYGQTDSYGSEVVAAESPVSGASGTLVSHVITGLTPNTTYHFRIVAHNSAGTTYSSDTTFTTPLKPAVILTADTADNDVDHPLEITFTPDGIFESGITAVIYGGMPLTSSADYTVSSGKITLLPAGGNDALQAPGTANLVISAAGCYDSSVAQTITAGAATTMAITTQPVPGINSGDSFLTQPTVILKDQYGNTCADGPSSAADVTASAANGTGTWDIGGTVTKAAVSGVATFDSLTCTQLNYGTGVMEFASGLVSGSSAAFDLPLKAAVTLTADTSDNSVDYEISIDYDSTAGFASAISSITFGGVSLTEGTDYEVYKDAIALKPAGGNPVLRKPDTALLVIKATGFRDSSVTQTITAGEVASLTVSTEPQPGPSSGDSFLTQPAVILKDQYGNTCADGPSAAADVTASAANGTGTWDIGGTVTKAAVSGVATFDSLTCTQLNYGTGVMEFASGLVSGSSAAFDLPLKAAVTLTADTSDNSVDYEISIDYDSTAGFASAISSITFGGVSLTEGTDYEVYKDAIALKPAGGNQALTKPASALLVIKAVGFRDSSVTQSITAGEAAYLTVSAEPKPGPNSGDAFAIQPIVILKDQYGNICTDGPSAATVVTASAAAGTGKWAIGGTVSKAAVNGTAVFAGLTATQLDPGTGAVRFISGAVSGTSLAFDLPSKASVVLSANVSGNSVDDAIEIVFPSNADFEKKVTCVKIGGTVLVPGTDYTVTNGKITLKPAGGNAALRKPGMLSVTVSSAGYKESTVSQTITAGAVASIAVTTQPVPGKVSGDAFATQPKVTLYDQYGNICIDGPSSAALVTVSAAADTGTWTIGGAASRLAVNGVAAFSGLTSANLTPGKGKMDFACGSFTVSSTVFSIPERNASISAASARFDKYADSGNYKNITVTLALNGNTLDTVRNGSAALVLNTDYTVNGDTAVIKKEYLAKQPKSTIKLTFDFSQGIDPVLSITVSDSTPSSSTEGTPAVNVIVNGEGQDAGSVHTTDQDGKTETTVTVDNEKLLKILDAKGNNASVIIPVATGSSVSSVVMNGQMMAALQTSQATLKVQTETSSYTLPSDGLDMVEVAKELGEDVPKDKVQVIITISEPPAERVQVVENAAEEGNFVIVVPAVEFKVECSYNEQTVEVKNFNAYVERTIVIPDGVDPYKITTAVVVRPDKTTYHVPTKITVIDGKYYAVINSLTNSTYTVIWHPVAYEDMKDHWAKEAVNDMGSRMVVTGVDDKNYAPDIEITRADFVADVVRALGLNPDEGENPYADVLDTDWYYGYVKAATAYGLIESDGTAPFAAQETVSREEAMAMICKAMEIAQMDITLSDGEAQTLLKSYKDGQNVSEAQVMNVAACLKAEITFALPGGDMKPQTPVTRAEAAAILRMLLIKANLI